MQGVADDAANIVLAQDGRIEDVPVAHFCLFLEV
jgi:hypothetical protein